MVGNLPATIVMVPGDVMRSETSGHGFAVGDFENDLFDTLWKLNRHEPTTRVQVVFARLVDHPNEIVRFGVQGLRRSSEIRARPRTRRS
jgi:hypothetical protein